MFFSKQMLLSFCFALHRLSSGQGGMEQSKGAKQKEKSSPPQQ
jgi:hypothetical protein